MPTNEEDFLHDKDIPVIYVDGFRIGYDAYKFTLDLISFEPNTKTFEFESRVILAPNTARDLADTFQISLTAYDGGNKGENIDRG